MTVASGSSTVSPGDSSRTSSGYSTSPSHDPSSISSERAKPSGPQTVSGLSLPEKPIVWRSPGRPSMWSPCMCVTKIAVIFIKDSGDSISWRCVPSAQSNRTTLGPCLTATEDMALSLDGIAAPVPRKVRSIMFSYRDNRGWHPC